MKARRPTLARLLALKVVRDTVALGAASVSLMVLMAVGVSLFVVFSEARANLTASYQRFYANTRFLSATVLLQSAPPSLVDTVGLIPGVRVAMGRRVKDGTLILRDRPRRRVMGRFVGLPSHEHPLLNDVQIIQGRYLEGRGECLLEQKFAEANELAPGSLVTGSYQGQQRDLLVVGVVASPEYIYPAPDKESPMPMPEVFGVCFLDDDALRQWLSLDKNVTEIHVSTDPGREDEVVAIMKALGERYGLRSWWTWREQPSHRLMMLDLTGWQALSVIFPSLFLCAAALSLYSSLGRIVRLQTGIVGFLRASGLSRSAVLLHYVAEGGLITLCGALPGLVVGHYGAGGLVRLYAHTLKIPLAITAPYPAVQAQAVLMAMVTGMAAALMPARTAARTSPAVAMRGDVTLDRMAPHDNWLMALTRRLPTLLRVPVRGLIRRPSRTLLAVCGLASGCAILLMTLGIYVSVSEGVGEYLDQFVQYEVEGLFSSPQAAGLVDGVSQVEGVTAASNTCLLPVRLTAPGGWQANLVCYGLPPGQRVMGLKDRGGNAIAFRPGQIWISVNTAARLHVEPGDALQLEWAFASRTRRLRTTLEVGGLYDSTFSGFALCEVHDLRRRLVDRAWPEATFGCLIACSPAIGKQIRRRLERDGMTINVNTMADVRRQIGTSLQITWTFVSIMLLFGAVLAGAVLHSISTVGILERMRELATLRSLGFSARAVTAMAAIELYLMAGLGLAAGMPLGNRLNTIFLGKFQTETFTFRLHLPLWTYVCASAIELSLVAWSLSQGVRQLRSIDLAQATKARE
jgi:putative ABC transport system permease protein